PKVYRLDSLAHKRKRSSVQTPVGKRRITNQRVPGHIALPKDIESSHALTKGFVSQKRKRSSIQRQCGERLITDQRVTSHPTVIDDVGSSNAQIKGLAAFHPEANIFLQSPRLTESSSRIRDPFDQEACLCQHKDKVQMDLGGCDRAHARAWSQSSGEIKCLVLDPETYSTLKLEVGFGHLLRPKNEFRALCLPNDVWAFSDKNWYQDYIKSFDKASGKHLIQYDDSEEEVLDLSTEKFESLEEEEAKKFRRLRRFSIEEDEEKVEGGLRICGDDDSEDEDWEMKTEKESVEDEEMKLEDLGLVNEDEVEEEVEEVVTPVVKKRKSSSGVKVDSVKKIKTESPISRCNLEPASNSNICVKSPTFVNNDVVGDRADKFTAREEEKFKFLGKDQKDANKISPGDENYDPRTLYLPPTFLKSLTGGQMGKFYELFEMDAHVGAKELNLQYMKGDQPHCGFPEKNFESNVEKVACKGYRVLVIEQIETPNQLDKRRKKDGSKDKVVKREICSMLVEYVL
ncbi:DNA mismatch repair protein MSH6, partial [Tanacetum coccineum]